MKQIFNAALICIVALSACTTPFKKAKDGSEYKIISTKKGPKVMTGNFMKMNALATYKDSVLNSSLEDTMPQYAMYDTANFPPPFKEIFKTIHVGDSIIIRISTDSIIAKSQGQAPPFMKKGQYVYQSFTIVNVYTTKEQMDSAQKTHIPVAKARAGKKEMELIQKELVANKAQIDKDDKLIEDYLAKNNIKATKTNWGTYIAVQAEGAGEKLTSANVAMVDYTGKTLDSNKVFDSNTDPKFKHLQPLEVNIGQMRSMILGLIDGLLQLKKGSKATLYIPSSLGYGKNGNGGEIKPDANLIFDIEVKDALTEEAFMAQQELKQQKMMEAEKMRADSIQNAPKK